jgi:hypothetical protein
LSACIESAAARDEIGVYLGRGTAKNIAGIVADIKPIACLVSGGGIDREKSDFQLPIPVWKVDFPINDVFPVSAG